MSKKSGNKPAAENAAAGSQTQNESQENSNLVKVRFLKVPSMFNLCWHIGQEAMINEALANEIIESKVGELVDE